MGKAQNGLWSVPRIVASVATIIDWILVLVTSVSDAIVHKLKVDSEFPFSAALDL